MQEIPIECAAIDVIGILAPLLFSISESCSAVPSFLSDKRTVFFCENFLGEYFVHSSKGLLYKFFRVLLDDFLYDFIVFLNLLGIEFESVSDRFHRLIF